MTRHSLGYLLSERAQKEHAQKFAAFIATPAVQSQSDETTVVTNSTFFEIQDSPEEHTVSQETPIITENVSAETTTPDLVPDSETVIEPATLDQTDNLLHPEHKTTQ